MSQSLSACTVSISRRQGNQLHLWGIRFFCSGISDPRLQVVVLGRVLWDYLRIGDPLERRELLQSGLCQKLDQQAIDGFGLLFGDGMPRAIYQANALKLRTCRMHAFECTWTLIHGPLL
jgi:hypothetical protein